MGILFFNKKLRFPNYKPWRELADAFYGMLVCHQLDFVMTHPEEIIILGGHEEQTVKRFLEYAVNKNDIKLLSFFLDDCGFRAKLTFGNIKEMAEWCIKKRNKLMLELLTCHCSFSEQQKLEINATMWNCGWCDSVGSNKDVL